PAGAVQGVVLKGVAEREEEKQGAALDPLSNHGGGDGREDHEEIDVDPPLGEGPDAADEARGASRNVGCDVESNCDVSAALRVRDPTEDEKEQATKGGGAQMMAVPKRSPVDGARGRNVRGGATPRAHPRVGCQEATSPRKYRKVDKGRYRLYFTIPKEERSFRAQRMHRFDISSRSREGGVGRWLTRSPLPAGAFTGAFSGPKIRFSSSISRGWPKRSL